MSTAMILLMLFAADESSVDDAATAKTDAIRTYYAKTAATYDFYRDAEKQQRLTLVNSPVFKWASDDAWSGDVFVWTYAGRPEMIGCILSGPNSANLREAYQEFHLLGERPIHDADMLSKFRWTPAEGLALRSIERAPAPAATAPLRLAQMRQILREFSAMMNANGEWELRLLPQPLMRYQPTDGDVVDGALFTFIWPKGTDPELILLLECRKTQDGLAWFYAPVRFSTRELWLNHEGKEVWRSASLVYANNSNPVKPYISSSIGIIPKARLDDKPSGSSKSN